MMQTVTGGRQPRPTRKKDAAGEELQPLTVEAAIRRVRKQPCGLNLLCVHLWEEAPLEVGHAGHAASHAQLIAAEEPRNLQRQRPDCPDE
jgi:hypothetical protein